MLDFNVSADFLSGYHVDKDASPQETLQTLKIKTSDFNFSDEDTVCAVAAEISYEIDGEEKTKTVVINLKQKDDDWYITTIK